MNQSYLNLFKRKERKTTNGSQVENVEYRGKNLLFKALQQEAFYPMPFGLSRHGMDIADIDRLANVPQIHAALSRIGELFSSQEEVITGGSNANRMDLQDLFDDPNSSNTSWADEKFAFCMDWYKNNNGVMQKIFTRGGEFEEIRSISSSSMYVNYDQYGMLSNRQEIISAETYNEIVRAGSNVFTEYMRSMPAFFQYLYYIVPFGSREIIFSKLNHCNRDVYGKGRVEILYEIIQVLLYGTRREVDRYLRNDMPYHGIMALKGGNEKTIKQFRERNRESMTYWDSDNDVRQHNYFSIPIVATGEKGGIDFVTPHINDREMQAIEKYEHIEEIAWMVFGLNANNMGRTDDVNRATAESQEEIIMRDMIVPLLKKFSYLLTQELCIREFGDKKMKITYPFLDIGKETRKMDLYQKYIRVLKYPVDEVREMENIEPLGGKFALPSEDQNPFNQGNNVGNGGSGNGNQGNDFYAAKSIDLSNILNKIITK